MIESLTKHVDKAIDSKFRIDEGRVRKTNVIKEYVRKESSAAQYDVAPSERLLQCWVRNVYHPREWMASLHRRACYQLDQ